MHMKNGPFPMLKHNQTMLNVAAIVAGRHRPPMHNSFARYTYNGRNIPALDQYYYCMYVLLKLSQPHCYCLLKIRIQSDFSIFRDPSRIRYEIRFSDLLCRTLLVTVFLQLLQGLARPAEVVP